MSKSFKELREESSKEYIRNMIGSVFADISLRIPETESYYSNWNFMLEDLLVCGAACRHKGEFIDVTTISIICDSNGNQPDPPLFAYQQIVYGKVVAEFTKDELEYFALPQGAIYSKGPTELVMEAKELVLRTFGVK